MTLRPEEGPKKSVRIFFCVLSAAVLAAGCASGPPPESGSDNGHRAAQQQRGDQPVTAADRQRFQQALADIDAGNLTQARESLETLVKRHPDLAPAQNNLGVVYRKLGKFSQAKAAYQAALAADPGYRQAHLNLGILYDVYLQNPAKALAQYKRYQALSDTPDDEVSKWIAALKQRL